jgi:anti-sigma B factor antagonist
MARRIRAPDARRNASAESMSAVVQADADVPRRPARRVVPGARPACVAATEHLESGASVVSVVGEVDLATARTLEQALLGAGEDPARGVIADLTGCGFLDSRGLVALIPTRARLERSDRPLQLVMSNPSVLRVFELTGLDELFEIYPSLGAAIDGDGNGDGRR